MVGHVQHHPRPLLHHSARELGEQGLGEVCGDGDVAPGVARHHGCPGRGLAGEGEQLHGGVAAEHLAAERGQLALLQRAVVGAGAELRLGHLVVHQPQPQPRRLLADSDAEEDDLKIEDNYNDGDNDIKER